MTYFLKENNGTCVAKVIDWAEKSTGKYKMCYNIECLAQETTGTKIWKNKLGNDPLGTTYTIRIFHGWRNCETEKILQNMQNISI